jgi:hypothetical protein
MKNNGTSGTIYDLFLGHRIAPFLSLEGRIYGGGGANVGGSGFLGLRLSF